MKLADYSTVVGILAGVMGLLVLFAPGVLRKLNDLSKRMIAQFDIAIFKYKIGYGVVLLGASLFLLFMGHFLRVKGR